MNSDPLISEIDISSFFPSVQKYFNRADLQLELRNSWGSQQANYRSEIRKYIHAHICDSDEILDLNKIPSLKKGSISISHDKNAGGFLWTPQQTQCGFDIEITERCRPEMVKRVSTDAEMQEAPFTSALWSAKEAAFKAIPLEQQPHSVSQLIVGKWEKFSHFPLWSWKILSDTSVNKSDENCSTYGILICQREHTISFAMRSTIR